MIRPSRQSGAVLILALILVLMLALIATTGMDQVVQGQKVVQTQAHFNQAFQAAESGLRWCEDELLGARVNAPEPEVLLALQSMPQEAPSVASVLSDWSDGNGLWWMSRQFWENYGVLAEPVGIEEGMDTYARCVVQEMVSEHSEFNEHNVEANPGDSARIQGSLRHFQVTAQGRSAQGRQEVVIQSDYFIHYY